MYAKSKTHATAANFQDWYWNNHRTINKALFRGTEKILINYLPLTSNIPFLSKMCITPPNNVVSFVIVVSSKNKKIGEYMEIAVLTVPINVAISATKEATPICSRKFCT